MGMFDSVFGKCPHCNKEVELQSKSGKRLLGRYKLKSVPVSIATDLNKKIDDFTNECDHCGEKFVLIAENIPKSVSCKLVPLTEELKEQIIEEKENYVDEDCHRDIEFDLNEDPFYKIKKDD